MCIQPFIVRMQIITSKKNHGEKKLGVSNINHETFFPVAEIYGAKTLLVMLLLI